MNAITRQEGEAISAKLTGLALLRAAVPEHLISPLPKGTKAQNECPNEQKINCNVCGGWHHPRVRHLDYVGHAAATHLLLDADEKWTWEPLASDENGLPRYDDEGGLWIKLTVCGVTRLGYGNADVKAHMDKGSRKKEIIGDSLRNAAMRFGLALDMWSKADLHAEPDTDDSQDQPPAPPPPPPAPPMYDVAAFKSNLPAWKDLVASGRKTPQDLIRMIETKGRLSAEQKAEIGKGVAK